MRRLLTVTVWLIIGHALAAGLFWELLQVPESSTATLALSAFIALLLIVLLAWVHGGALAASRPEAAAGSALGKGLLELPAVALGALLFLAVWWLTMRAASWHTAYAGQMDAWIIARSGKSDTARLHAGILCVIWFLRWGVGLTLALSLAAWSARDGVGALASTRWLASALHPVRWLAVTALMGLMLAIPWHYVYWRPTGLPIDAEPWFVGAKLAAMAVLAAFGWALALKVVTPPTRPVP
jgi:hypothetical protein